MCKPCRNEAKRERYKINPETMLENQRRWRRSQKDGLHYVYYLPEEHYVGITNYVANRISQHRRGGKLTDNHEVLASFEREVDAKWFEIQLHQRGYLG